MYNVNMEITSIQNAKVKQWMKYHQKKYRDKDHLFLVEGEHLIEEALKSNQVKTLLLRQGSQNNFSYDIETFYLSDVVMNKLSNNVSDVNYIAVCIQKGMESERMERLILLDNIQDPGNLGTIIRSAYSFGFDGIYLSEHCVDVYNEKVIRSTQGALFHIPLIQRPLKSVIEELSQQGVHIYATSLHQAANLSDVKKEHKMAFIFGNEGSGVSQSLIDMSQTSLKIEMFAFESLNVGVAASICMYQFRRGEDSDV